MVTVYICCVMNCRRKASCNSISTLAASIDLWSLLFDNSKMRQLGGKLILTVTEISGNLHLLRSFCDLLHCAAGCEDILMNNKLS
jgi:hypothetical protein